MSKGVGAGKPGPPLAFLKLFSEAISRRRDRWGNWGLGWEETWSPAGQCDLKLCRKGGRVRPCGVQVAFED